jgi:Na+-driven multidrug efflux pump
MVVSLSLMVPVLRMMNTPADIMGMALNYISIIFMGIPVVMGYNLLASILRAVGDSRSPLIAMLIASALNIALDLLFVMVFGWGVGGAAVATVISQLVSGLFCLRVVLQLPSVSATLCWYVQATFSVVVQCKSCQTRRLCATI